MNEEDPQIESIDGRRKRSARSRAAIITATLTLLENGNLSPTAKQIAEEAGVGLRSFFRHFEDMDAFWKPSTSRHANITNICFFCPNPMVILRHACLIISTYYRMRLSV